MDSQHLVGTGLDQVMQRIEAAGLRYAITVGPLVRLVGNRGQAGTRKPGPSSAARLKIGGAAAWVPSPVEPADPSTGEAPVFLVGGKEYVFPTIRLFAGEATPQFWTLSDWLLNAFTIWKFPRLGKDAESATILEGLLANAKISEANVADGLAEVVRYALLGSRPRDKKCPAVRALGLAMPHRQMPSWLRGVGATPLARAVARRMVLTAVIDSDLPRQSRADGHRISPESEHDHGIDPVHTPEGKEKIRFIGHLGVSVGVADGKLAPPGPGVCLSPSTARIPFARFDSPRRLLVAANMQVQATTLSVNELPLVQVPEPGDDPPGVNLRTAYVAWRGWNHEDAWVLSESAAAKLSTSPEITHTIPISAVEGEPVEVVVVGQQVMRGEPLLKRTLSPIMLAPEMDGLVRVRLGGGDLSQVTVATDVGDKASVTGEVVAVERDDLVPNADCSLGQVPPETAGRFRTVIRVRVRRDLPLRVGDKLANRHGHKGVVGRILPDREMPRWLARISHR